MLYQLQQRIHTLAHNAVDNASGGPPSFPAEGVVFSHWQFNHDDPWWTHNYWLAAAEIEANDYVQAWERFRKTLNKVVPRISFVSQCYAEYLGQPFLILRKHSDVAYVRCVKETTGCGLMFMDEERKALNLLLNDLKIPDEFFYYWNDATNSHGYSSRLLLMLLALEAFVKTGKRGVDYTKLELIFGPELNKDLWGIKGDSDDALRNRLVHGEYFQAKDGEKDYLELLHNKMMTYFNDSILHQELLLENVVNPQRHPFGNKNQACGFIKAIGNAKLNLVDVVQDMEKNENNVNNLENYKNVIDDGLSKNY